MIDISIVIVSYNAKQMLKECLDSLESIENKQVFVVDNASIDGSSDMIASNYPWVSLIQNQKNIGFAPANNQAFPLCTGRYIMMLNADTIVLDGAVDKIINYMNGNPSAGIVGCKLLNTDNTLQPSVTSFPNILKDSIGIFLKGTFLTNTPFARKLFSAIGKLTGKSASRFDTHEETKEIDYPRGACFTIRRETFEQIGMLDEEYFFTGEEMDYAFRSKKAGWKIYYYPKAAIIHHDHGSSKNMMGKVFVQTRKSALIFYQKHHSPYYTNMMKLTVSIALFFKILIEFIKLPFKLCKLRQSLAAIESYFYIIRLHFDKKFAKQNVFNEMKFRYN